MAARQAGELGDFAVRRDMAAGDGADDGVDRPFGLARRRDCCRDARSWQHTTLVHREELLKDE